MNRNETTQRAHWRAIALAGVLLAGLTFGGMAGAQQAKAPAAPATPPLVSERGNVPIEGTSKVDMFRVERDRAAIPRDFVQQPPLIPHSVKGYNITQNFNKCMDCHSWSRYKETGATKVSLTHFKTREGTELANISPRRYFCMQCHVPQYDAKPLVDNTYRPAPSMKQP